MTIKSKLTVILKADDIVVTESVDVALWIEVLAKIQDMEKKVPVDSTSTVSGKSLMCPDCRSSRVKSACLACRAEWG